MAGDWLKVELTLPEKPEVIAIADSLGMSEDEVVGKLIRFWRWCDQQLISCHAPSVTLSFLDRHIGAHGFGQALVDAGWLVVSADGLEIPNYDRHLSKGSKTRVLATERKNRSRNSHTSVTEMSRSERDETVTRAREEKSIHGPSTRTRETTGPDRKEGGGKGSRLAVHVDAIGPMADAIFQACRYRGDNGGNLWGVAALLESQLGEITEAEVYSAAQGAALNGRDKPAHFFKCLDESLHKRGYDLTDLLRQVKIIPQWPQKKPYREDHS